MADPLSIAGLGLGAVSLAIQLADGLRKGFVFIENAAHAEQDSRAFAISLAIEHQRFASWSDLSGLNQAAEVDKKNHDGSHARESRKPKQEFEKFIKYGGPVIIPILLEMSMVMSQLSNSVDRYSEFIDIPADDNVVATSEGADIAEHPAHAPSLEQRAQSLSLSVRNTKQPFVHEDDNDHESNSTEPKSSAKGILKRMLKGGKKAANIKSLRWVIHDAKACGGKIIRVRELNAFLHESLNQAARDRQIEKDDLFQEMLVRVERNTRAVLLAVTDNHAATSGDNASTLSGSTAVEQPFRSDFARQAAQFILDVFDQNSRTEIPVQVDPAEVSSLEYLEELEGDLRQSVKLRGDRHGWVEWRKYTEINIAKHGELPRMRLDPDVELRMSRLVLLLKIQNKPREFCVPPCQGYFVDEDETRIGMLYMPPAEAQVQTPRSLFSYLGKVEVSLSNRIRVARTLAQWLLHLHSVRWLHKGIDSASVLFFSPDEKPSLDNPYMTGFSYARTSSTDPSRRTTKPYYDSSHIYYVHPEYQNSTHSGCYREGYDIYSLGIILIELAYWQPIEDILRSSAQSSSKNSVTTEDAAQAGYDVSTRSRPLNAEDEGRRFVTGQHPVLEHLRTLVGDKYHAVVRSCLQGMYASEDAPESAVEASSDILEAYSRSVVEPLRTIAL